jgi:hypothetical protein
MQLFRRLVCHFGPRRFFSTRTSSFDRRTRVKAKVIRYCPLVTRGTSDGTVLEFPKLCPRKHICSCIINDPQKWILCPRKQDSNEVKFCHASYGERQCSCIQNGIRYTLAATQYQRKVTLEETMYQILTFTYPGLKDVIHRVQMILNEEKKKSEIQNNREEQEKKELEIQDNGEEPEKEISEIQDNHEERELLWDHLMKEAKEALDQLRIENTVSQNNTSKLEAEIRWHKILLKMCLQNSNTSDGQKWLHEVTNIKEKINHLEIKLKDLH